MTGIVGLIIAFVMAVWLYQVVNRHGGRMPWLWAAGALVFWPLTLTIAGFEYDEFAMKVVGVSGLGLTVLGIVITFSFIGLVAFM
jgi:hypothetical protein